MTRTPLRLALLLVTALTASAVAACAAPTRDPAADPAPAQTRVDGGPVGETWPDGAAAAGWWRGDDVPLEPRDGPLSVWTGEELLLIGGMLGPPCPANASCVMGELAADGAAYDPATDSWRSIAAAPAPLAFGTAAHAAGHVVATATTAAEARGETDEIAVAYDIEADAWEALTLPGGVSPADYALASDGERILFASYSDETGERTDLAYDPRTGVWEELPDDPIGSAFDRRLTPTPHGILLTAKTLVPDPGANKPALVRAALLDPATGEWTTLPDLPQIGGWSWAVFGDLLVDPQLGGADGGEVGNWGREYPYGGVLTLPAGEWSALPASPPVRPHTALGTVTGERWSVSLGHVYDALLGTWTALRPPFGIPVERPPAAAVWAGSRFLVVGGGDDPADRRSVWQYAPAT